MSARGTLTGGTSSEGRVSGYVFKIVRESTGRTQQQLAADLRVSAATIQGWESGRRPLMAMQPGSSWRCAADSATSARQLFSCGHSPRPSKRTTFSAMRSPPPMVPPTLPGIRSARGCSAAR